jgi:glucokinase
VSSAGTGAGDAGEPPAEGAAAQRLVGVDVGGTKCLGIAITPTGDQLAELRLPTPDDPDELIATIARIARDLGATGSVGIGVPGLVNRDGVLLAAPNVTGVRDLPLRDLVAAASGLEVRVDNDNTIACLAEWKLGAARGSRDTLLVGIGTGIGGGFVSGGALQRGAHGFAAEFGHMIVQPDGIPCPCGQHGCWERYASGTGLATIAADAVAAGRLSWADTTQEIRGEDVTELARTGNAEALAVLDVFSDWLAIGLANLTNLFDPDTIVLAGGLSADPEIFLPRITTALGNRLWGTSLRQHPALRFAALGPAAGAIGAALLNLD